MFNPGPRVKLKRVWGLEFRVLGLKPNAFTLSSAMQIAVFYMPGRLEWMGNWYCRRNTDRIARVFMLVSQSYSRIP